jgi:hypothetical protein
MTPFLSPFRRLGLALITGVTVVGAQGAAPAPPPKPKPVEFPKDSAGRIIFARETFSYNRAGRRDPFASLIATGEIRPLVEDLALTGVIIDPAGRNSIALLKDVSTSQLYRARVGAVFGRVRVGAIRPREVVLVIDEFGFSRQEILMLQAPTRERTP